MEKRHKYGAKKTRGFASKAEADRYDELRLRELAGDIFDLQVQASFDVNPEGCERIRYVADFVYSEKGDARLIVEDVKGVSTPVFVIKAKLFRWSHPGCEF